MSSNTLTPLLKRLEQSGWVKRQRSEVDKRQLVVFNAKGHEQQEAVFEAVAQCLPPEFDETQYNETKAVLSKLEQSLKALTNK